MKKVNAIIETASDGSYSIYSDADDLGYLLLGFGDTVEEAKSEFVEGYKEMRKYYAEVGKPFTELEVTYKFDVPSFLEYYAKVISIERLSRLSDVRKKRLHNYITGTQRPTPKTLEKIQGAIWAIARDLSSVRLV